MGSVEQKFLVVGGLGDLGRNRILFAFRALGIAADVADPGTPPCDLPPDLVLYNTDPKEVPDPGRYSGVVVATPNYLHREHCEWALTAAGIPCLCEKPLAHTLQDAEALAALAGDCRHPLLVSADHYLFKGRSRLVLENPHLLERIGHLQCIRARILEASGISPGREWLLDPSQSGGGLWVDLGIHLVTFVMQLLNHPSWQITGVKRSDVTASGAELSMEVGATFGQVRAEFEVAKGAADTRKEVKLQGEGGTIRIDWDTDTVDGADLPSPRTDAAGGYVAMLREFAAVCREGMEARRLLVTCADALEALRLVLAAYR